MKDPCPLGSELLLRRVKHCHLENRKHLEKGQWKDVTLQAEGRMGSKVWVWVWGKGSSKEI